MPHAARRLRPLTTIGSPGTHAPAASTVSGTVTWITWNGPGAVKLRWTSLASRGAPFTVRADPTTNASLAPSSGSWATSQGGRLCPTRAPPSLGRPGRRGRVGRPYSAAATLSGMVGMIQSDS